VIPASLFSMTDANLRCNFISVDSPVVRDTLIYLLHNRKTYRADGRPERTPPRTHQPPSSVSFHPLSDFPLVHIAVLISNCHSYGNFASFYTS
jgi:hypothetical protein